MDSSLSHLDLLETARMLERAAIGADVPTLHRELCRLRNELTDHLADEASELERLASVPRRVVVIGQQRLRALIDDLLADSTTGPQGQCACLSRTADIVRALARQARLENDLLSERAVVGSDPKLRSFF